MFSEQWLMDLLQCVLVSCSWNAPVACANPRTQTKASLACSYQIVAKCASSLHTSVQFFFDYFVKSLEFIFIHFPREFRYSRVMCPGEVNSASITEGENVDTSWTESFIISGRDWKGNKQGLEPDYPLICTVSRYKTKLSPRKALDNVVTSGTICIPISEKHSHIVRATVVEKKRFQLINSEKSVMSEQLARAEGISNRE